MFKIFDSGNEGVVMRRVAGDVDLHVWNGRDLYPGPLLEKGEWGAREALAIGNVVRKVEDHAGSFGKRQPEDDINEVFGEPSRVR